MKTAPFNFWKRLKEIDMFFQKNDPVHKSMRRIVKQLEKARITYAIVGGMAVNAHGHHRTTDDLDVLLTAEGFTDFCARFVPKYYEGHEKRPHRFTDRKHQIIVDFLVTGLFPGSGKPGPISYPDPAAVQETIDNAQFVDLLNLVQLKLAARRYQDFADVVSLIRVHQLEESFADGLHPSLRNDYIECLEEKRREEEYEARQ